jgi:hypothetical protein
MPANVPITGKIGVAAPDAHSGSSSGPLCGPPDDAKASGESMHDPMPPPHFSKPNLKNLRQEAQEAADNGVGGG